MNFKPDYQNIVDAAYNRVPKRLPLYEHIVSYEKIEEILDIPLLPLLQGDENDINEFFYHYCRFFKEHGYDTVSFEAGICGALPGGGALGNSMVDPIIKTREDFDSYPWDNIEDFYFEENTKFFTALRNNMPEGMKAIGGVGNGIFECVQDLVGYENLCYIAADDEDLYADLFKKVGETNLKIWTRFMKEFSDIFCVLRFGDDLGFKSSTLLSTDDIKEHIIPAYKPIIDLVHSYDLPFLLHSCGRIFSVMPDLIASGIDAKHSNEDQIAEFSYWVDTYGEEIGNFGGIDMDVVCRSSYEDMKAYIHKVLDHCIGKGGFAFSTGNSIPSYVPAKGYLNMIEIVRSYRGDFN